MRAVSLTCATALLTLAAAIPVKPAAAATCADLFPFVCLFGPEAQAMQPAAPLAVEPTAYAAEPAIPGRKRRVARKPLKMHAEDLATVVEVETESAAQPDKADVAAEGIPALSYGPGPAFAMSVRLAPSMLEQIRPRSSACMVEQTFNDLFRLAQGLDNKIATLEPEPLRPMMLLAVKTGSTGLYATADASDVTHSIATSPAGEQ